MSSLSSSEILKLIKQEERKKKGKPLVETMFSGWTGDDNLKLLAEAVRDKKKIVYLDVGTAKFGENLNRYDNEGKPLTKRKFDIKYTEHFGGSVHVSSNDGSFASGYFSYKRLRDALV